jgi:hypothetical protein
VNVFVDKEHVLFIGNVEMSRVTTKPMFATSMDPDQPAHLRSLISIHAFLLSVSLLVKELVSKRTAWILIRLRGYTGWSGSMLVANALCWFCRDATQINISMFSGDRLVKSSGCVLVHQGGRIESNVRDLHGLFVLYREIQ